MRQGQQNRRGRGRNNNNNGNNNQNRKGQNPLTRSFESTGPDVKLRGTPAHIAEKYIALARDAQSSGDPVHINLTGDYLWRSSAKIGAGKFRPLRPLQPA